MRLHVGTRVTRGGGVRLLMVRGEHNTARRTQSPFFCAPDASARLHACSQDEEERVPPQRVSSVSDRGAPCPDPRGVRLLFFSAIVCGYRKEGCQTVPSRPKTEHVCPERENPQLGTETNLVDDDRPERRGL